MTRDFFLDLADALDEPLQHVVHAAEGRLHAAVGIALFGAQIGEPAGKGFVGAGRWGRRRRRFAQGAPRLIELSEQFGDHALERAGIGAGAPVYLVVQRAQRLLERAGVEDGIGQPVDARAEIVDHALESAGVDGRRRRPVELGADFAHQIFQGPGVERRRIGGGALIDLVVQRAQRLLEGARVDDRIGPPIDARAKIVDHVLESARIDGGRPVEFGADLAHQPFERPRVERRRDDRRACAGPVRGAPCR